jgi:hypothetical protein
MTTEPPLMPPMPSALTFKLVARCSVSKLIKKPYNVNLS